MLSESKIRWMWSEAHNDTSDRMAYQVLAEMVEAEVRKQDDALIRQLVEAMEGVKALNMGGELALWTAEFDRLLSAITAGRARLKTNKPC